MAFNSREIRFVPVRKVPPSLRSLWLPVFLVPTCMVFAPRVWSYSPASQPNRSISEPGGNFQQKLARIRGNLNPATDLGEIAQAAAQFATALATAC
jgi:hypothetical protein